MNSKQYEKLTFVNSSIVSVKYQVPEIPNKIFYKSMNLYSFVLNSTFWERCYKDRFSLPWSCNTL